MSEKDLFMRYAKDVGDHGVLSFDEVAELTKKIQQGNRKALKKLIESNLKLVISVAMNFRYMGMEFIDVVNSGNLGLVKAAYKYKSEYGLKFSTYAIWWIRQAVLAELRDRGRTIRIPANRRDIKHKHISIHQPVGDKKTVSDSLVHPCAAPDENAERSMLAKYLEEKMRVLKPKEKKALEILYGLGTDGEEHTLEYASKIMSVTNERVRQLKGQALRKLRANGALMKC